MTFGVFIRAIIEMYFIGLICCTSEIYNGDLSSTSKILSFSSAILFFILVHSGTVLCLQQWISLRYEGVEGDRYFTEFFDGIKDNHAKRSFGFFSLLRKSVLIIWVNTAQSVPTVPKIIIFWVLQGIFTVYILILRPYKLKRDNIKDWINEVLFICISSIHIYFNTKDAWRSEIVWVIVLI